jgi:intracellular sulfur oxidation DsrE/DsrF family protein
MIAMSRSLLAAFAIGFLAMTAAHAQGGKPHRVATQVDQNDPAVMNLALNNAQNVIQYYRDKGEDVDVEIVAYGPGLNMLRADTSPVKDRIAQIASADATFPSKIVFSACNNTKQAMEKREGHPITIIPQAGIVPSGVVRIMQLEEQGWSYVRP